MMAFLLLQEKEKIENIYKIILTKATKGKVELEICLSKLSNKFLRTPPNSLFQARLEDLICKK